MDKKILYSKTAQDCLSEMYNNDEGSYIHVDNTAAENDAPCYLSANDYDFAEDDDALYNSMQSYQDLLQEAKYYLEDNPSHGATAKGLVDAFLSADYGYSFTTWVQELIITYK